jgi:hypothetical protein
MGNNFPTCIWNCCNNPLPFPLCKPAFPFPSFLNRLAAAKRDIVCLQEIRLTFALADAVASVDPATAASGVFRQDPTMNAPCRVTLLTRGAAVLVARPFDERLNRARLRLCSVPWNSVAVAGVTCCHA